MGEKKTFFRMENIRYFKGRVDTDRQVFSEVFEVGRVGHSRDQYPRDSELNSCRLEKRFVH